MTDMRHISGDFDLTPWIAKPLEEALRRVFYTDDPPFITLPADRNETDPLMLNVFFPFGREECDGPVFEVSIREIVAYALDGRREGREQIIPADHHADVLPLAAALRELAEKIEQDLAGTDRTFFREKTS